MHALILFPHIWLWEYIYRFQYFCIKSKQRSVLNSDIRCAVATVYSHFDKLVFMNQAQSSR